MKVAKYLLIALLVVGVLASISWILRNSIIERISGPILREYGLAVIDVSLDALATENAAISYLELEHESGTNISIDHLVLPIRSSTRGVRTYSAEAVTIDVPSEGDSEPVALAQLIDQLLSLRAALPETEVVVAELNIAPYPTVREFRWFSTGELQELATNLNVVHLAAQIIGKDEDSFEAKISLKQTALNTPEQSITTMIRHTDGGIVISGATALSLPTLGTIATSIGAMLGTTLAGVEFASGTAILEFEAELPFDTNESSSIRAHLKPAAPFELAYSVKSGVVNVVSVRSASPIKLDITYPENQWSIGGEQASLAMSYENWNNITASITDFNCKNGPSCFMNLDVTMDNADLTFATVNRLELVATQDVALNEDGIQVRIRPNADLSLTGVSVAGTELAEVNAVLMSDAKLELSDIGWALLAESLEARVETLSIDDDIVFSSPLTLHDLTVSDLDQSMSINAMIESASSELNWVERTLSFPGFTGDVSLHDEDVVAELTTVGLHDEATVRAEHNLDTDAGRISISGASISFDAQNLSGRISPWNEDWDIKAGTFSANLEMNWQYSDSGWQLGGRSAMTMSDLAGAHSDTAFGGLSTEIVASFETVTGLAVEPARIAIDLLDVGLPIEFITADYTLLPDSLSVDIKNLRMQVFGGIVKADPFIYELESEKNSLLLHAESIELTELLTLKEFEAIELSGSIGADLPVIIEGDEISILEGKLFGEEPGGVIKYQPIIAPADAETSAIGIVADALSNFEYDTLTSTVDYSTDGDLVLQMQIAGRNPDMMGNRPVILNLGVENNIPQMLRSLQAARTVEDILEKRLEK